MQEPNRFPVEKRDKRGSAWRFMQGVNTFMKGFSSNINKIGRHVQQDDGISDLLVADQGMMPARAPRRGEE